MFKYPARYVDTKKNCELHGISRSTLFKWIKDWELENPGQIFPGKIKVRGSSKLLLWNPKQFHDEFLVPYKFNPVTATIIFKGGAKIYES